MYSAVNLNIFDILHDVKNAEMRALYCKFNRATSKTWTRTLENLDSEKPGP